MVESTLAYRRSDEERRDIFKSWNRPDKAFFAAGACHILAHLFITLNPDKGFKLIKIEPLHGLPGNHVFASDGTQAFDFNGIVAEADLIKANEDDYKKAFGAWEYERVEISEGLIEYLKNHADLRAPEYFPYLPWERAYNYIKALES